MTAKLNISLVVYYPDKDLLQHTLHSLFDAVIKAKNANILADYFLTLVDNSVTVAHSYLEELLDQDWLNHYAIIRAATNVGYGRGHNLAIKTQTGDLHLVINPDVIVDDNVIVACIMCLRQYPQAGLVTPLCHRPDGEQEYLCKGYPSVFTLLLRGFAPQWLKRLFLARLARYDLREQENTTRTDVLIASGCFMFFRQQALQEIQGFDPRFFLYFEDFDLSLRLRQQWQIIFYPSAKIMHYGGHSAKKGLRHVMMFVSSAYRFFSLHGWRLY